jgi:hypothetical protein
MITCKIDATKIDKQYLFKGKTREDGTAPLYLDIALIENRDGVDQYGNHGFIAQSVPKDVREAGVKGPILGNFKRIEVKSAAGSAQPQREQAPAKPDDIPF